MRKETICFLPRLEGQGGPSSFQAKLKKGLENRGFEVHHDPKRKDTAALLVIGGSHQLFDIYHARQRGVRVVQRLDGMNWMHRVRKTGLRHYLRAESSNLLLATTRRYLVDHVVYQSNFARDWWQTTRGGVRATDQVIYNGVDLDFYSPAGYEKVPEDFVRVLVIEANFSGGYESGLFNAIDFSLAFQQKLGRQVELYIAGNAPDSLKKDVGKKSKDILHWAGLIPKAEIPSIDRSAHMLFSADINAACPNTVIEAMACGLPVISYATGSLPELVEGDAGRVAPYSANFWKLEPPRPDRLVEAAMEILQNNHHFRQAARTLAETHFSLELMTEKYLEAFRLCLSNQAGV